MIWGDEEEENIAQTEGGKTKNKEGESSQTANFFYI